MTPNAHSARRPRPRLQRRRRRQRPHSPSASPQANSRSVPRTDLQGVGWRGVGWRAGGVVCVGCGSAPACVYFGCEVAMA